MFLYLIEQHSKFLLRTLQVLYTCTLSDSTNINTIIEFVPDSNNEIVWNELLAIMQPNFKIEGVNAYQTMDLI